MAWVKKPDLAGFIGVLVIYPYNRISRNRMIVRVYLYVIEVES